MLIAIRKEPNGRIYIDKNLMENIDYTRPPYNFTIVEVDDIYHDCEGYDFNENLTFSINKYSARKQKESAQMRIVELKIWFDTEYTKQEQKYRRLRTLSKLCDDGSNPEIKLRELYILAEQNRLEIQQLEEVNNDKGIDY